MVLVSVVAMFIVAISNARSDASVSEDHRTGTFVWVLGAWLMVQGILVAIGFLHWESVYSTPGWLHISDHLDRVLTLISLGMVVSGFVIALVGFVMVDKAKDRRGWQLYVDWREKYNERIRREAGIR